MNEDVFEVALADGGGDDAVVEMHLLLAFEEEVIDELLLPVAVGVALEAADAGVDEVEVKHGDVGPGAESRGKLEGVMPDIALHERMSNFLTILQLQNLIIIALLLGNLVVCRRSADLEQLLRRTKDAIRLLDGSAERLEERLFGTGRAEGSRRRGS